VDVYLFVVVGFNSHEVNKNFRSVDACLFDTVIFNEGESLIAAL